MTGAGLLSSARDIAGARTTPIVAAMIGTPAQRGFGLWCRGAGWVSRGLLWFRG